jgi:hypothetical protein
MASIGEVAYYFSERLALVLESVDPWSELQKIRTRPSDWVGQPHSHWLSTYIVTQGLCRSCDERQNLLPLLSLFPPHLVSTTAYTVGR